MQKFLYRSLFVLFILMLLIVIFKSEFQNLGEQRDKYLKYYVIFGSFFSIYLLGFFSSKIFRLNILVSTIVIIFFFYSLESYILLSNYKNAKTKENLYLKKDNKEKEYDKRSKIEYFKFRKKDNKEIKLAIYPDSFNKKKNINIFPLSGISKKETILCNENGYFVNYKSDRYGFNNKDIEWDNDSIEYLLLGDSLVHGFCVDEQYNMTSQLKNISNKSVINLSYGGNGPIIQLASLKEFKPKNVKKIIWTYSEWNDLIDITFEFNNPILKKYYSNKNYLQNLKEKQNIVDGIGNKIVEKNNNIYLQSHFKNFIKNFIFLNNTRFLISKKTTFYIPEENFIILENILLEFVRFSKKNNSIPYFVYIPSFDTFNNTINEANYLKIIKIINKLDIKFIDIRSEVIKDKIAIKSLFPYGLPGHYSGKGYKYISDKIYQKTN
jgi:hypothetical protein